MTSWSAEAGVHLPAMPQLRKIGCTEVWQQYRLNDFPGGAGLIHSRTLQQKRADVLVYPTPVFKRKLALAGEIILRFSASASTPDTDFFAVLSDVLPDGRAMYLTMG